MRPSSACAILLLGLLAAPDVHAQASGGERRLHIEMGRGVARLRMHVPGRIAADPDRSSFTDRSLSLAPGSVVTAMRAQSRTGSWLGAALWPTSKADEVFYGRQGVTASAAAAAERTLLTWTPGGANLAMTLDDPRSPERAAELSMLAPTSYASGRDQLDLSLMLTDGPLTIEVTGGHGDDQLLLDEVGIAPGSPHTLREGATVALEPSDREPLRGSIAMAKAGAKTLVRAHADTPRHLGDPPREARVVIVIDTSRSMNRDRRDAAVAVARAYLERLPDARAAVVAYDRHLHPLQPSLVSASEAIASLAHLPPLANGSRLDLALDHASRLLDGQPGPHRVLVLTDGLVRSALTDEALTQVTRRTGALVQLGLIGASKQAGLARLDHHGWATAARATGGLTWSINAPTAGSVSAPVIEELVRPIAIDQLQVRWLDGKREPPSWGHRIEEGDALDLEEIQTGATSGLEITGELWSRPVRLRLQPTAAGNAAWTRLAIGSFLHGQLDSNEQRELDRHAHVLSPLHSLLAMGPGLDHDLGVLHGDSIGGDHSIGDIGSSTGIGLGFSRVANLPDSIAAQVTSAWQRCAGGQGTGEVVLEATLREVVDVISVTLSGAPPTARSCLEQAVWQLDLEDHQRSFALRNVPLGITP